MPGSEVMVTFMDWLLKITFDVSFCILLILVVRRFFARFFGARLSRILWIVLFVRCIVPWSFPVNIYPTSLLAEIKSTINPGHSEDSSIQPEQEVIRPHEEIFGAESITVIQAAPVPERKKLFTMEMLRIACAGIWFSGLVIFLGMTILRNGRIAHYAAKTPRPVPSWLQEIFLDCRARLKMKVWPILIVSSGIDSPCLIGAVRPRIFMPHDLVSKNNKEQLTHILLHELTHIKQGDIWLSWFWTLVCSLQWFNPLVWLAGKYMYRDCEMACDERVLSMIESKNRNGYSRSVLELLKKVNLPSRCPGLACVVERKTNVEKRLGMIMRFKVRSNRQIASGLFVMLTIAALSLAGFADSAKTEKLSSLKAELIGRVEDFFLHNFRDITDRKTIEWGKTVDEANGNRSIRYKYEADTLGKNKRIYNQKFTFKPDGEFVSVENLDIVTSEELSKPVETLPVNFCLGENEPGRNLEKMTVSGTGRQVYLHRGSVLSNAEIKTAYIQKEDTGCGINIVFTEAGGKKFAEVTKDNVGKILGIVVDGKLMMAPVIQEPVTGGESFIIGNLSLKEAERIARGILGEVGSVKPELTARAAGIVRWHDGTYPSGTGGSSDLIRGNQMISGRKYNDPAKSDWKSEIHWILIGHRGKNDIYRFRCTFTPSNGSAVSYTAEAEYNGTESVIVFQDQWQTISIEQGSISLPWKAQYQQVW